MNYTKPFMMISKLTDGSQVANVYIPQGDSVFQIPCVDRLSAIRLLECLDKDTLL